MEKVLCCISVEEKSAFVIRLDVEKIGKNIKIDLIAQKYEMFTILKIFNKEKKTRKNDMQ